MLWITSYMGRSSRRLRPATWPGRYKHTHTHTPLLNQCDLDLKFFRMTLSLFSRRRWEPASLTRFPLTPSPWPASPPTRRWPQVTSALYQSCLLPRHFGCIDGEIHILHVFVLHLDFYCFYKPPSCLFGNKFMFFGVWEISRFKILQNVTNPASTALLPNNPSEHKAVT